MKANSLLKKSDQTGWRTTKAERVKFYIGDMGRTLSGSIVTTFMSMFLLLKGLDLRIVSIALILVNVIDSVDDVVFGYIIDKIKFKQTGFFKKITGDGKYLPWFRLMFPFFPIFTICFFLMPNVDTIGLGGCIAWFIVTDLLYDFTYTTVEVPMNSILITLTDNLDERNTLVQTKSILSSLATVIVPMIWLVLVSSKVGLPLVWVAIVSAIIFFFMMLPLTKGVKEHNVELANVSDVEKERYSLKDMFLCVKNNKYLLLLLLSSFCATALGTSAGSIGLFVSFYVLGDELVLTIPIVISFPLVIAGQLLTKKLANKFGKINTLLVGSAIGIAGFLGIFMFGAIGINQSIANFRANNPGVEMIGKLGISTGWIVILTVLLVVQAAPGNVANMVRSFLLPDAIEYGRYKTGKDCSGICTSLNSFVTKLCTSIASGAGLMVLGWAGWNPIQAEDFADLQRQVDAGGALQPLNTINTLWIVYSLIPTIGNILAWIVMFFYRMRDKDIKLIAECNAGNITRAECNMMMSKSYDKSYKVSSINLFKIDQISKKINKARMAKYENATYVGQQLEIRRKNFGSIICYMYKADGLEENVPVIVALHNGCYLDGGALLIDKYCNKLANDSKSIVVSIDYKTVDQQRFPYPQKEVVDVVRYLIAHNDRFGIDINKITLLGIGAGCSIAAGANIMLNEKGIRVNSQVLVDPILDLSKQLPEGLVNNKLLTTKDKKLLNDMIFGGTKPDTGTISPLCATEDELKMMPSTTVISYGNDELSNQALEFVNKLKENSISATLIENPTINHKFLSETEVVCS